MPSCCVVHNSVWSCNALTVSAALLRNCSMICDVMQRRANWLRKTPNFSLKSLTSWLHLNSVSRDRQSTNHESTVAARTKAWVCCRSPAGIVGLNPVGDMEVCFLWMLCVVRQRSLLLIIKPTRCTNSPNLFLEQNSTCFGQFLCPSSGVSHCTHSKPVCHIPLLCVQWKTVDDGQRNCPKHFIPKINLRN
jgi:hypothetical protein